MKILENRREKMKKKKISNLNGDAYDDEKLEDKEKKENQNPLEERNIQNMKLKLINEE